MVRLSSVTPAILLSLALAACGGGGGGGSSTQSAPPSSALITSQEPNAPQLTGNMATDGLIWFNFRRQQIGLPALTRNVLIDTAAQGHSEYQKLNNRITHEQTPGPGFTGAVLLDRLNQANYQFTPGIGFAFGEVIAKTVGTDGVSAAEALITAIYHRFVIFEPLFKEFGGGFATTSNGFTYFTTNFASNGLGQGLGAGNFTVYPFNGQKNLPNNFFSNSEIPDPVPNRDEVGYPISIITNATECITTTSFSVTPRSGGTPLPTRLLTYASDLGPVSDPHPTPLSAAAIVPLSPLTANTVYDVTFTGNISAIDSNGTGCVGDGPAITHIWSFTTK